MGFVATSESSDFEEESFAPPPKRRRTSDSVSECSERRPRTQPMSNLDSNFSAPSRIRKGTSEIRLTLSRENLAEIPSILHPRNAATKITTMTSFTSLSLSPWLLKTLRTLSITNPTPIQLRTIPSILAGSSVIASSPTGTGKTLAFALPILQVWAQDPSGIYAVILTATRELATQIYEQFEVLGCTQGLKVVLVTGGSEMLPQALALARRPHIVVATPGRLADHISQSGNDTVVGLRRCKVLVLDEADRLLDEKARMLEDLGTCFSALPPKSDRQTLLYTATMTDEVRALQKGKEKCSVLMVDLSQEAEAHGLDKSTRNDHDTEGSVSIQKTLLPSKLRQTYILAPSPQKAAYLHVFLNHILSPATSTHSSENQILIFTNRTLTAQYLHLTLSLLEHPVTSLHSLLAQRERTKNLTDFRARKAKILVSTDVGSRGLDIDGVATVINYDVPRDPGDYVHRVGRTARAGRNGLSVTFIGPRDVALIHAIEARVNGKMQEWKNLGEQVVNIETRVVKDGGKAVKEVGAARLEALRIIGGIRDENGRVRRIKKKR